MYALICCIGHAVAQHIVGVHQQHAGVGAAARPLCPHCRRCGRAGPDGGPCGLLGRAGNGKHTCTNDAVRHKGE